MRVYLSAERADLKRLVAREPMSARRGYAVTPSLRVWFGQGDDEELEHAASLRAAETAEFVLPVEVDAADVLDKGNATNPGAIELRSGVASRDVAAILVAADDELSWYGVQEADSLIR